MKRSINNNEFHIKDEELRKLSQLILEIENDPTIYNSLSEDQILEMTCIILSKSSYHRSLNEIEILKNYTKHNEFLNKIRNQPQGEFVLERCLRKMQYVYLSKGQYLFREGDRGTKFYIILNGAVSIIKRVHIEGETYSEREIVVLHDGQYFGELALEMDAPRSASVKGASYDVHLGMLEAEDYMVIKRTLQNQQKQMYFEEFAKLTLFQNWKFLSIKQMFDSVHLQTVGLNHTIYKEGDQSNEVYFIQSGEFKVIKSLRPQKKGDINQSEEYQMKIGQEKDDLEFLKEQFVEKKQKQSNQERIDELYQKKKYGNLIASEKILVMTLKFLGAGEMFGELEVLKSQDLVRQFTIISTQENNKVYSVSRRDFIRVLYNDKGLFNSLNVLVDQKLRQILSQIKVYEKNFIDQSEKQSILEKTLNKGYLHPQQDEEENEQKRQNQKTSSQIQKISSRKVLIDNRNRDLTLTMESPEVDYTLSHHQMKSAYKTFRQKTHDICNQTSRTGKKSNRSNKFRVSESVLGVKLGQLNIRIPKSQPYIQQNSPNTRLDFMKKSQNGQFYFKQSLPLILQNNYIRVKQKQI